MHCSCCLLPLGVILNDIINPTPRVTAVELNTETLSLKVGESVTLTAIVYGDPSQDVICQTSDSRLATLGYGEVAALAPGEVRHCLQRLRSYKVRLRDHQHRCSRAS